MISECSFIRVLDAVKHQFYEIIDMVLVACETLINEHSLII